MASRLNKFLEYQQITFGTRELLVPLKTKAIVLPFVQKQVAVEQVTQLEPPEVIEERICMLIAEYQLPHPWAEAVIKLQAMTRPKSIPLKAWEDIHLACTQLYRDDFSLLQLIISHKWSLHDIYGCNQKTPMYRFDEMGLLLLLHAGDEVIGVNAERIKILKSSSSLVVFSRGLQPARERVLLHELIS